MRPLPPADLMEMRAENINRFIPAPEVIEWARETFIVEGASLWNEDHRHLEHAQFGALWTTCGNRRQGRVIVGQAELGDPRAFGKWAKARQEQQLVEWFGDVPDFILTFDANYAAVCSDAEWCALVEHELYHCAQARDQYGAPRFHRDGLPFFEMRGHDIEEFIGVVRRYGADASGVRAMVDAAKRPPEIAFASVAHACGTCQLRAA